MKRIPSTISKALGLMEQVPNLESPKMQEQFIWQAFYTLIQAWKSRKSYRAHVLELIEELEKLHEQYGDENFIANKTSFKKKALNELGIDLYMNQFENRAFDYRK